MYTPCCSIHFRWIALISSQNNLSSLTLRFKYSFVFTTAWNVKFLFEFVYDFPLFNNNFIIAFNCSIKKTLRFDFLKSFPDFEAEEGLRKEKRLRYAKVRALLKYCPPLQLPYFRRKFSLLHKIENSEFNLSSEVQVRPYWFGCKYQSIMSGSTFQLGTTSNKI